MNMVNTQQPLNVYNLRQYFSKKDLSAHALRLNSYTPMSKKKKEKNSHTSRTNSSTPTPI